MSTPNGPPPLPPRPPPGAAPGSVLPTVEKQHCSLATWAMVCGFLGFMCVPAILAVVLGHMALSRIDKSGKTLTGSGQAIAGLIMGYMAVALIPMIGLMSAIAVPSFIRARSRAQASTVLNEARQLDAAKDAYALENSHTGTDKADFADLTPFLKAGSKLSTNGGSDSLGGAFRIGTIQERLRVSPQTQETLSAATGGATFWGPYS